jgi:threonine 3-dehydrogenase
LLGIPPGKSPVDWSRIVFKAITIKGVYGREIFETWYKMIAMLENGLDIRRVITHRFPVDDFREGFETMRGGFRARSCSTGVEPGGRSLT